jgi:hypothetical protein
LVGAAGSAKGIVVVEHAEIGAGLGPKIIWLGRMNVGIVAAGSGKNVVIGGGEGDLLADVDFGTVDVGEGGSFTRLLMKGAFGF